MTQSSATGGFIHHHPMRRITLTYMPGKTALTATDEQLLEKYLALHDFEYNLMKKTEELYASFSPIDKELNVLRENLDKIKNRLNDTIVLTDKLSEASYIPAETNLEKIRERNTATADELVAYHEQLNTLYQEMTYHQETLNECINESEDGSEKVWDEYDTVSHAHSQNYMANTIDIVSMDNDLDKFRGMQNLYEDKRNTFIDLCDKVLTNYTTLNLETNIVLEVWKEFSKRYELMQVVANLQHSQISGSIN